MHFAPTLAAILAVTLSGFIVADPMCCDESCSICQVLCEGVVCSDVPAFAWCCDVQNKRDESGRSVMVNSRGELIIIPPRKMFH
ncbi:hypothetical protein F5Y16DRAFT_301699 [Xylariaceae sp. FL0255]|nr:hypothetical protein F5Y16DRAFT_301699 [Xylariaceae sp. FL0255]